MEAGMVRKVGRKAEVKLVEEIGVMDGEIQGLVG